MQIQKARITQLRQERNKKTKKKMTFLERKLMHDFQKEMQQLLENKR